MEKKQTTDRYTLADLENWSAFAKDIDPPVRLGVLGDPVAHSLSPQMQNAALGACDIHMQYARFSSRTRIVFTAPARVADSSASSICVKAAILCGTVRLTPMK